MPQVEDIQNSFNTGEVSPFLLGRTDLAKYKNACEKIENFIVKVQGGVSRRPGTRFLFTLPGPGRLIPFSSDSDDSVILIFLDEVIQPYNVVSGLSSSPVTSPYKFVDNLELIKFIRIGNIMYLVHPKYPVFKLIRFSAGPISAFELVEVMFYSSPATQQDEDISNGTLGILRSTLVPVTSGFAFISQYNGYGLFAMSDVGKTFAAGSGSGTITAFQDGMHITISLTTPFDKSSYGGAFGGIWTIDGIQRDPTGKIGVIIAGGNPGSTDGDSSWIADAPVFIKGDIGRIIVAGTGTAVINNVVGTTDTDPVTGATLYNTVNVSTLNQFDDTFYNPGSWFLRGSPGSYFSAGSLNEPPATGGSVDQYGTIVSPPKAWRGSSQFGLGSIVTVRATTKHPVDFSFVQSTGSVYAHVSYTGGFTDTFRASDANRYVFFSGGYGKVIEVVDSTTVKIKILSSPTLTETDAQGNLLIASAFPGAWFLEDSAFSVEKGYPAAVAFFQDRVWFAGTDANPQTIWGSQIDDFENFAKGILDDAGIEYTIATGDTDKILWAQPYQGNLIVGTFKGEHVLGGAGSATVGQNNSVITPSNVIVNSQSAYGVTNIQPQIIQEVLFYVQRAQFTVYQMEFNIQSATYGSKNLSILNDLITKTPFIEMAYQQDPFKIVWFITANPNLLDGVPVGAGLVGLTYDREQDVWAWHRHIAIPGQFVSMCSVPHFVNNAVTDEIYFISKRTTPIPSPFEPSLYTFEIMDYNVQLDSCTHIVSGSPLTEVTGSVLDHLINTTVHVVADGAILPNKLLLSNTYTFPVGFTAKDIQIGFNYNSSLLTVRPEVSSSGTIQGLLKRWNRIWIRVYQSLGLSINDQFIPNRETNDNLDQGVPVFTGDLDVTNLGWDRTGRILIEQKNPLPANVLAIFGKLSIGEN